MIPQIITANNITVFLRGQPYTLDQSHLNFTALRRALKNNLPEQVVWDLVSVPRFIAKVSAGAMELREDGIFFDGNQITGYLVELVMGLYKDGHDVQPYVNFMDNLYKNPSRTAIQELFLFMEAARLPITKDGYFLAYKAVRSNYTDKHSGKFDNSVGSVLSMPRQEVDDRRDITCSYGFHAAAYEYAKNFLWNAFEDRMVVVKINPADVVSVPSDYQNQKLRCTGYEVVGEIEDKSDFLKGRTLYDYSSNVDDTVELAEEGWDEPEWNGFYDDLADESDDLEAAILAELVSNAAPDVQLDSYEGVSYVTDESGTTFRITTLVERE